MVKSSRWQELCITYAKSPNGKNKAMQEVVHE